MHDILYEKINTQYKVVNESAASRGRTATKRERESYRKIADDVFLEGMHASEPPVPSHGRNMRHTTQLECLVVGQSIVVQKEKCR